MISLPRPPSTVLRGGGFCLILALAGLACERDPDPVPPPSSVKLENVPPDMLLEGPIEVFGVRLPVNSEVRGQHVSAATVRVAHPMEKVANYLRAHLEATAVETGPQKTVFTGARRKNGSPTDPSLKIVVSRTTLGTDLIFQVQPKLSASGPARPYSDPREEGTNGEGGGLPMPPEVAAKLPKRPPRPNASAAPRE